MEQLSSLNCQHPYMTRGVDGLRLCVMCESWLNAFGIVDLKIYDKNYKRAKKAERRQKYVEMAREDDDDFDLE